MMIADIFWGEMIVWDFGKMFSEYFRGDDHVG
jgi:hypothetical protein